jgi:uncharacterized protein with ACT and thioredoxin-like domain
MNVFHNPVIHLITENLVDILRDIGFVCSEHNINIMLIQQETVIHYHDFGYFSHSRFDPENVALGRVQEDVVIFRLISVVRKITLQNAFRAFLVDV